MTKVEQLAALRRTHLLWFTMKVFETLEPDKPPLSPAEYLAALCHALEEVEAGRTTRLVIAMPPRHLKSITTSVALVAWMLGRNPSCKIMVATYSQDLARKHSEDTRTILNAEWYQALFPGTRLKDGGSRQLELVTTAGGVRKAVPLGGTITGFGADVIIIDDLMKAADAHSVAALEEVRRNFDNTLTTRLNDNARGAIISIQQRLHEYDLPAYLIEKGYQTLILPAIAERDESIPIGQGRFYERKVGTLLDATRQTREMLDQIRRDAGSQVFGAQYQQNPVLPEGNLIRIEWFGRTDALPERHEMVRVIQSWDPAMSSALTADYSVCTTWGYCDGRWYLLDVLRQRLDYPDLKRAVLRLARKWRPDYVIIEDASAGMSLWQDLRSERKRDVRHGFIPLMRRVTASKEERLSGQTGQLEAGLCVLPNSAPWLDDFVSELRAFPRGQHDDQVDSLSQFLEFFMEKGATMARPRDAAGRMMTIMRRT